jgi:putative nucleotidyltransferase with HDIG domain
MLKVINDFIANAEFLPPSFHLLPRLLLLLEDIESNADALANLIRVDPGLTADILRICNSAAHASAYPAESIQEAILRLGFREVHRVVMAVIASPLLHDPHVAYPEGEPDLWNHSLAAATASQFLAGKAGIDVEIAFTAALLHDIGKIVLSKVNPAEFSSSVALAAERRIPLYEVERSKFKTDHARVGAQLLERWGFPKSIRNAIQFHHEPSPNSAAFPLAACVYLSNVLAYRVTNVSVLPQYVLGPDARVLKEFHLTQPELEALVPDAQEEFLKLAEQFR